MESINSLLKNSMKPTGQRKPLSDSGRVGELEAAIRKTYLAIDKPAPEAMGMKIKIALFLEDLEGIPTPALDKVFRVARQRKAGFFPTTGDLMLAWADIKAAMEREVDSVKQRQKALPKPFDPELVAKFKTIPLMAPEDRVREYDLLHTKYPLAGYGKEAERERCRLNIPKAR